MAPADWLKSSNPNAGRIQSYGETEQMSSAKVIAKATQQPESDVIEVDEQLVNHLVQAVERADCSLRPFAHLYFTELFPKELYKEMLANLPSKEVYTGHKHREAQLPDGTSSRQVMPFVPERMARLTEDQRRFWTGIWVALDDDRLRKAVFKRLAPDIARRMKVKASEVTEIPVLAKDELTRDLPGYKISPHKDKFTKLVTMQIYLPSDDSQRDFGTSLYSRSWFRRINPKLKKLNRKLKKFGMKQLREFTHVKTLDFMPNSGYAFAVGNDSWHGRGTLPPGSEERLTLTHIYYLKPEVVSSED